MPAFFGEYDVIKSLETIPGINLFGDGSTFFFVRGGNRDQNLVMLDDAPLFNPSHLLGLFSTIIPEAVKDIKVYKGPFPANVGGRLSSVIDIRTRDGNMKEIKTEGSLGLISAKASVEGPVKKDRSSFFLSARRSWFDWFFRQQNPLLDKLRFFDLNGKYNLIVNQNNRLFISGYAGRDIFRQGQSTGNSSGLAWQNLSGSIRWYHILRPDFFMNTTLSASSYDYDLYTSFEDRISWHSHISNINLKSDLSWFLSSHSTLRAGTWIGGFNFNPGNLTYRGQIAGWTGTLVPIRNTISYGTYIRHETTLGKIMFDYGLRFSGWANIGATWENRYDEQHRVTKTVYYPAGKFYHNRMALEPRVAVRLNAGKNRIFEAGYSLTTQFMQMISNSVSPFTSFEVWLPSGPSLAPQKAHQLDIGYRKLWTPKGYSFKVQGWLKEMLNQIDYNDHARLLLNSALEGELRSGTATGAGLEITIAKTKGRLTGQAGYAFSHVTLYIPELNNANPYPVYYDRPHSFSLLLHYNIHTRWEASAQWLIQSGSPFSAPTSFYDYRGYSVPYYEAKNNDRLPPYHRLDLSVTFHLNRHPGKFEHDLSFSLFNFYGRKNPWEINYNKIILENRQLTVPVNYYRQPNLVTTQIYIFQTIPSIHYHFKF